MPTKSFTLQNLFYLWSAGWLTKLSLAKGRRKNRMENHSIPCVLGAVTASLAFLECSINGLYGHASSKLGRKTNYRRMLSSIYHDKLKFANLPWLTKYQIALALAQKPMFDLGAEPYQSVELLNQLRNELIHPKEIMSGIDEEWNFDKGRPTTNLERRLVGRFAFNVAKKREYDEFIPHRCLSSACALWAVRSAAEFYIEFESRLPAKAYLSQTAEECKAVLKQMPKVTSVNKIMGLLNG